MRECDPVIGAAFAAAGYPELLDDTGCVHPGTAGGRMIGTVLARMMGKRYVGLVDSDNDFPGAIGPASTSPLPPAPGNATSARRSSTNARPRSGPRWSPPSPPRG